MGLDWLFGWVCSVLAVTTDDVEAVVERLAAAWDADPEDDEALAAALVEAVGVARVSPDSELPPVAELASDLADVYERLGRVDEAVAAMREAIEAGWDGVPDGRCRIAEILTAAGRLDEATVIWRQVAGELPDDVWVHNNAGIEYARAGEHETAVGYLTRGLELALDSGDPERLVDQLNHFRSSTLAALGEEPDELQARATQFLATPSHPPSHPPSRPPLRGLPSRGVPARETAARSSAVDRGGHAAAEVLALAWFPEGQFEEAVTRWPDLPDSWGASDYAGYCAALEGHLTRIADATGIAPRIAPLVIERYLSWCETTGCDPAVSGSRAGYAAELARTGAVASWPPGRNRPCWCGSSRKYKQCCRAAARHEGTTL